MRVALLRAEHVRRKDAYQQAKAEWEANALQLPAEEHAAAAPMAPTYPVGRNYIDNLIRAARAAIGCADGAPDCPFHFPEEDWADFVKGILACGNADCRMGKSEMVTETAEAATPAAAEIPAASAEALKE